MIKRAARLEEIVGFGIDRVAASSEEKGGSHGGPILRMENLGTEIPLPPEAIAVMSATLDDTKSHAEFAEKYHVPFPLLADNKQEAAKAYGVLTSKMGMSYAKRETFLIDPQGKIAKHYRDVDPEKNSKQVLADLAALSKPAG